ncbi:thap domain-containing protein 9 [Holotrichia oblita]|uniref:Thap domain-containing protein 9 n=1 Tax=Holotrichia oblita TaxID=644536 RepID=A0ACB9TN10_HOLOL|nr:thap domain-containing protein 9 [Holotrichia oblita]
MGAPKFVNTCVLVKGLDQTSSATIAVFTDVPQPSTSDTYTDTDQKNLDQTTSAAVALFTNVVQPSTSGTYTDRGHKNLVTVSVQTPLKLSENSPRKRRWRGKVQFLKRKVKQIQSREDARKKCEVAVSDDSFIKFCETHFTQATANLFKLHLKLANRNEHGYRYSNEFKQFALTTYFLGPKVYRFLSSSLRLPSKSTLCRITNKWNIAAGLSEFVCKVVEAKIATVNEEAKDCILCIDEMTLKTFLFYHRSKDTIIGFHETIQRSYVPANNALVLMIRGVNVNWKQPFAYFFTCSSCPVNDLKIIIFNAINKLIQIGFNVLALVSDQGTNFIRFSKNVGVSEASPYFTVNNRKIFYIFDTPHLLKSTRNNFLLHKFVIKEGTTDKKYIVDFYNQDKKQSFRLAPSLSDAHLSPNNFQKMKVKLAAQILSASVAAALNTYIALNFLPAAAMATATFISKIDNLFDVLNSQSFSSTKILNRPFKGDKSQMKVLDEMLELFRNLTILNENGVDVTKKMNFINGWRITITSILALWELMKNKGMKYLCTRRLNQDALENFFGTIRQQGGNCLNPTPIQFARAFKKLFCLNYFHCSKTQIVSVI